MKNKKEYFVSVIICTHNRANLLKKSIESVISQSVPKNKYEIIIVDNNSTDKTKEVVDSYRYISNLRYIKVEKVGLSNARNAGIKNSKGDIIAFIDDDAIATKDWLKNMLCVYTNVVPQPGIVGGKVLPIYISEKPKWMSERLERALSVLNWSNKGFFISKNEWLVGANISYLRTLLNKCGGFDIQLGRKGKKLLSMEENLLREKAEREGYKCYYEPSITVYHYILPERLKKKWFLKRSYYQGISESILRVKNEKMDNRKKINIILFNIKNTIFNYRNFISLLISSNDPGEFFNKYFHYSRIGLIVGLIRSF